MTLLIVSCNNSVPECRGKVVLDVADDHPTRIQANDHVLQPTEAALTLRHQHHARVAITGLVQLHVPDLGRDHLRHGAITRTAATATSHLVLAIPQVLTQSSLHTTFEDRLNPLGQEPTLTDQRNTPPSGHSHQPIKQQAIKQLTPQLPCLRPQLPLLRGHEHSQPPSTRKTTTHTNHLTRPAGQVIDQGHPVEHGVSLSEPESVPGDHVVLVRSRWPVVSRTHPLEK